MCVFFQYVPKESFKYFSIYFQRNLTKFVIKLHERKTTALLCSWFCGVMPSGNLYRKIPKIRPSMYKPLNLVTQKTLR